MNWIYISYLEESRPPLWSNGQSSWLQIQRSGLDSRRYQIFWEVVGLKRGPVRLVSTIKKLLGRKSSGPGQESREYGRRDPSGWPRDFQYPQKVSTNFTDMPWSLAQSVWFARRLRQQTAERTSIVLQLGKWPLRRKEDSIQLILQK
jgi:hypothetical protein